MADDQALGRSLRRVRVFGLTLASDFPFRTPLGSASGPADLHFTCDREPGTVPDTPPDPPVFESRARLPGGDPVIRLFHTPSGDLVRYSEVADFHLDDRTIHCRLFDPRYDFMVEIHLLGLVFAYWSERRGTPVLHASAVSVGGRAVLFAATNRGGKSSLATTFMAAGHALVSDDQVGIRSEGGHYLARPGLPSLRLWPDQAARVWRGWEALERAHPAHDKRMVPVGEGGFGTFLDRPVEIGAIYIPDRRPCDPHAGEVEIRPLSPREAVRELIRASFIAHVADGVGLGPDRLGVLAGLASRVPVRELRYAEGLDRLPRIRDAILEDRARHVEGGP